MLGRLRVKCPQCGNVVEIVGPTNCAKCGVPLAAFPASIMIYRMGSPLGVAVGAGIYINTQPFGMLANKETTLISLPYGTYNLHMTLGMTRRCTDMAITLTPEAPIAYIKAHVKPGFWSNTMVLEPSTPDQMPH